MHLVPVYGAEKMRATGQFGYRGETKGGIGGCDTPPPNPKKPVFKAVSIGEFGLLYAACSSARSAARTPLSQSFPLPDPYQMIQHTTTPHPLPLVASKISGRAPCFQGHGESFRCRGRFQENKYGRKIHSQQTEKHLRK